MNVCEISHLKAFIFRFTSHRRHVFDWFSARDTDGNFNNLSCLVSCWWYICITITWPFCSLPPLFGVKRIVYILLLFKNIYFFENPFPASISGSFNSSLEMWLPWRSTDTSLTLLIRELQHHGCTIAEYTFCCWFHRKNCKIRRQQSYLQSYHRNVHPYLCLFDYYLLLFPCVEHRSYLHSSSITLRWLCRNK